MPNYNGWRDKIRRFEQENPQCKPDPKRREGRKGPGGASTRKVTGVKRRRNIVLPGIVAGTLLLVPTTTTKPEVKVYSCVGTFDPPYPNRTKLMIIVPELVAPYLSARVMGRYVDSYYIYKLPQAGYEVYQAVWEDYITEHNPN